MFLAVPLTMVLKVMLDNSDELRWVSVAITKEKRRPMLTPDEDDLELADDGLLSDEMNLTGVTPEN
jgi:hypothetical protein